MVCCQYSINMSALRYRGYCFIDRTEFKFVKLSVSAIGEKRQTEVAIRRVQAPRAGDDLGNRRAGGA